MSRAEANGEDRPQPPTALRGGHLTLRVLRQKLWKPANVDNDWAVFVIVGREGSGKSHTCLSMLEKADPSFDAERVHFEPKGFLETIHEMPKAERRGRAVMLDESGVGMGVRSWYDSDQVKVNKLMQTARDDNMIVGVTLPRLSELDSQFRGRLHGFVEMRDLEPDEYAVISWKNVKPTRDENSKLYKQYPRMRHAGRKRRVTRLSIGPPSEELATAYEERKATFKEELYEETIEGLEDGDEEEELSEKEIAEQILENDMVDEFTNTHNGNGTTYVDHDLIKTEFEISRRKARRVKKQVEKKQEVAA